MTGDEAERAAISSRKKVAFVWTAIFLIAFFGTIFVDMRFNIPAPWKQVAMIGAFLLAMPMIRAHYAARKSGFNAALRRYLTRLFTAMGVYMVSLFSANYVVRHGLVEGWALWVLALLPGLSIIGAFYAVAMYIIEQKDEYMRMLLVRQALVASAFSLAIATVWGFLENFGLVAHVDAYYWAIFWFLGLGVGSFVNRITLGTWGGC